MKKFPLIIYIIFDDFFLLVIFKQKSVSKL